MEQDIDQLVGETKINVAKNAKKKAARKARKLRKKERERKKKAEDSGSIMPAFSEEIAQESDAESSKSEEDDELLEDKKWSIILPDHIETSYVYEMRTFHTKFWICNEPNEPIAHSAPTTYWICKEHTKFGVYKAYMMMPSFERGRLIKKPSHFSVLETSNSDMAHYQRYISKKLREEKLGKAVVQVDFVDDCFVSLEEVSCDFKCWYASTYNNYTGDSTGWWKHIETALKKLFRRICKSLPRLYPSCYHGNWVNGLAISNGEAKMYNMRFPVEGGYQDDVKSLCELFMKILFREHPTEFNVPIKWELPQKDTIVPDEKLCSTEFAHFLLSLQRFYKREVNIVFPFSPFYWNSSERMKFIEEVYNVIWVYQLCSIEVFDSFFDANWKWWELDGPLRGFFEYVAKHDSRKVAGEHFYEKWYRPTISVIFFKGCHFYYNDYFPRHLYSEEIEIELNRTLGICFHIYRAALRLIENVEISKDVKDGFIAALKSVGCLGVYHNIS